MKLLFIIPGLDHGGTNRVLKNMLAIMDQSQMDIEIMTFCDKGFYHKDFERFFATLCTANDRCNRHICWVAKTGANCDVYAASRVENHIYNLVGQIE